MPKYSLLPLIMSYQATLEDTEYISRSKILILIGFGSFNIRSKILRFFITVLVKYNYYCNISIVKVVAKHKIPN